MSISSVGSLGTANAYSFGSSTLTISPSSDVPAGDLIVVWATWTSHYFFTPQGRQVTEMRCTDDAGNIYVQLVNGYMYEAYIAMYACQPRNGLQTTDTITLQHYGAGAKAVSLWQFELSSPTARWGFGLDGMASGGIATADPFTVAHNLDPTREYLMLHILGAQGPNTDTYTWDSDYTQITGAGTNTGGSLGGAPPSPEDVHVRGGFRIVSGTSYEDCNVASTIDRDNDQALVALTELDDDADYPSFPNTPLLDDFNRADEDPLGGIWQVGGIHPGFGSAYNKVVSNRAAMAAGSGSGSTYVDADLTGGEYEVWGTLAVVGDLILAYGTGAGGSSTVAAQGVGYRTSSNRVPLPQMSFGNTSFNGDLPSSNDNAIVWQPGALSAGHKIGLQNLYIGGLWTQHLWMDTGSGWEWVAATVRIGFSSLVLAGSLSMGMEGNTTTRLDDFGGGILTRDIFVPQIIRRLPVNR